MTASIKAELDLEISKLRASVSKAQALIAELADNAQGHASRIGKAVEKFGDSIMKRAISGIGGMAMAILKFPVDVFLFAAKNVAALTAAIGLAGIALGGFGAAGIAHSMKIASAFEQTRIEVSRFVGSMANADKLLSRISAHAVSGPFDAKAMEQATASVTRKGAGQEAFGMVSTVSLMTRDAQTIQSLSEALADGYAKGKYELAQINAFQEKGIDIAGALAKTYSWTNQELSDAVRTGKVGLEEMAAAMAALTGAGGQFEHYIQQQSRTWDGLMARLKSGVYELSKSFGIPIVDSLRPGIEALIGYVNEATYKFIYSGKSKADEIASTIADAGYYLSAAVQELGDPQTLKQFAGDMKIVLDVAIASFTIGLIGAAVAFGQAMAKALNIAKPEWLLIFEKKILGNAKASIGAQLSFQKFTQPLVQKIGGASNRETQKWAIAENQRAVDNMGARIAEIDSDLAARKTRKPGQFADDVIAAGKSAFSAFMDQTAKNWNEQMDKIGGSVESLANTHQRIQDRAESLKRNAKREPDSPPSGAPYAVQTLEDSGSGSGSARGLAPMKPLMQRMAFGGFQAAINMISGRSAQEVMSEELKKQTGVMSNTNSLIQNLIRAVEKNVPVTLPATLGVPGMFADA